MAAIKLVIFGQKWKATFPPAVEAKMLARLGAKYGYTEPNALPKADFVAKAILDEILANAKAKEIEEVFKAAAIEARASAADAFDAIPIEADV
jgi:hypothetical protein